MNTSVITAYYLGENKNSPFVQIVNGDSSSNKEELKNILVNLDLTVEQKKELSSLQNHSMYLTPITNNHYDAGTTFSSYEDLKAWTKYTNNYTEQLKTLKDSSWLNSHFSEGHKDLSISMEKKIEDGKSILDGSIMGFSQAREEGVASKGLDLGENPKDLGYSSWNYESTQVAKNFFAFNGGKENAVIDLNGVEGKLILDLDSSNTLNNKEEILKVEDLISFDSNRDGYLDQDDDYFNKIKVVTGNSQDGYSFTSLGTLVNQISIEEFAGEYAFKNLGNSDEVFVKENTLSRYVDAKYTHAQYSSNALDNFFQEQITDSDGWVVRNESNESFFDSLAYERTAIDGNSYLQTSGVFDSRESVEEVTQLQVERFEKLYNEYKKERDSVSRANEDLINELKDSNIKVDLELVENSSSAYLKTLEKEFERITNLSFSEANLSKVNKLVKEGKTDDIFRDIDTISAIKDNGDGSYSFRFDSGRIITKDKLFFDTNEIAENEYRSSVMLSSDLEDLKGNSKEISEDKLNDFAVWNDSKFQTLKEFGVEQVIIQEKEEEKRLSLLFKFENGDKENYEGSLYIIKSGSSSFRFQNSKELELILKNPYIEKNISQASLSSIYT